MGTTRREHLEVLPEATKQLVYKRISNDWLNINLGSNLVEVLDEEVDKEDAILGAFMWDSDEGAEYWESIHNNYFV